MSGGGNRVYLVAAEYSANPAALGAAQSATTHERVFFRYPRSSSAWPGLRAGPAEPITLTDLLADASRRVLSTVTAAFPDPSEILGVIEDLLVTTMPGIAPDEIMSPALVPQTLRAMLDLDPRCRCQLVVGTSDSGAWAFASAVRLLRDRVGTALVAAGQLIPPGYAGQQRIRTVLGARDQAAGLDMLAVGDLLMDVLRRHAGASPQQMRAAVGEIRRSKLEAATHYPASQRSAGAGLEAELPITPYFSSLDIAPACCGAAAVLVTSDEALVARLRAVGAGVWEASRDQAPRDRPGLAGEHGLPSSEGPEGQRRRFRRSRVVEVLGVGEGGANPDVTWRRSPMASLSPMRQALEAAADDARVPFETLSQSAFAVLHDAFPSIELGFLRSLGLSLEQAQLRMASCWSNPCGGLMSFGHALGASGLVQICQVQHLLSGDTRYLPTRAPSWPDSGASALAASVGGPFSHIVASVFHGGTADDTGAKGGAPHAHATRRPPWSGEARSPATHRVREASVAEARRTEARRSAGRYRAALSTGQPELRYVEGVTSVDLRSSLVGLPPAAVALTVGRAAESAGRGDLGPALLERLLDLQSRLRSGAARILPDYEDAVRAVAGEAKLAERLKLALRVPIALTAALPDARSGDSAKSLLGRTRDVVALGAFAQRAEQRLAFLRLAEDGLGEYGAPDDSAAWLPPWEADATWPVGGPLGGPERLQAERAALVAAPNASARARTLADVAVVELLVEDLVPDADEVALLGEVRRACAWFGRGEVSVGRALGVVSVTVVAPWTQGPALGRDAVLAAFELSHGRRDQRRIAIALGRAPAARLDPEGLVLVPPSTLQRARRASQAALAPLVVDPAPELALHEQLSAMGLGARDGLYVYPKVTS